MSRSRQELEQMGATVRDRFQAEKRLLSFDEYLDEFLAHPWRHSRDAARYLKDCFDHFGSYPVKRPWGEETRYRLFDQEFLSATDGKREYLVGHEQLQHSLYRVLSNFVREGRANRLILMHGPNGSAKSTFALCLMRALEAYSATDQGALYRFSWVFPRGRDDKRLGFGSSWEEASHDSFAHLEAEKIDAKLTSELREHPLLLLPLEERRKLVRRAYEQSGIEESVPDWIWNGQLTHKNADIANALLTAYDGDLRRVLAHVQVERFYVSRRYRIGAITIGPEMAVDASERQITADRSPTSLPASLSALSLFVTFGELVDGSGGVIEYSDLLARPLDAWKYLLTAIETGEVSLQMSILPVNAVLLASTNENHLAAFKQHPEYNSFRARLHRVRVGYLRNVDDEQKIYDSQIVPQVRTHVAPHATYVAASWAVLTRLMKSDPQHYDETALGQIAADLAPVEKLRLYSEGLIPGRLNDEAAKILRAGMAEVVHEFDNQDVYEGIAGASPREVRTLLLDASQHPGYRCLSSPAVLECIQGLCSRGDYDFLKQQPDAGYYDHRGFIQQVKGLWLNYVDEEIRNAAGLVEEAQYEDLFARYIMHVSLWVKNERYTNPLTGQSEEADENLMQNVESVLDVDDSETFRHNLINSIAAHAIDNPNAAVEHAKLFPRYVEQVKQSYFAERKKQIAGLILDCLSLLAGSGESLEAAELRQAEEALTYLRERAGYCDHCARDTLSELYKDRYEI